VGFVLVLVVQEAAMIPVYLFFIACLGDGCEVVQGRYLGGPVACVTQVQFIGAQWIAEHKPGATLLRWGCRIGHPT
jgi:hypothetical protein